MVNNFKGKTESHRLHKKQIGLHIGLCIAYGFSVSPKGNNRVMLITANT